MKEVLNMRGCVLIGTLHLQVASVVFGDGCTVKYWLTAEGYQKLTSLCPCAVWFAKAGLEEKKAMFVAGLKESTIECADA